MAKNQTYRNNGGQHRLADGTKVNKGSVFVCDDPDLLTNFPNKFVLVNTDETPVNTGDGTPAGGAGTETAKTGDSGPTGGKEAGDSTDVTKEFNLKADTEGEITVRKESGKWNVYEGEDEPLNEKPLNKNKVQAFIDSYLNE